MGFCGRSGMWDEGEKESWCPGFKLDLESKAFLLLTDVFVQPPPPVLLNIPIKSRTAGSFGWE